MSIYHVIFCNIIRLPFILFPLARGVNWVDWSDQDQTVDKKKSKCSFHTSFGIDVVSF